MYLKFNSVKNFLLLLIFSFTLLGCTDETILDFEEETSIQTLSSFDKGEVSTSKAVKRHFNVTLMGDNAVPPVDTNAVGQAIVTINKNKTMIHYKIITANIDDVFGAHFHMAAADQNGGVVAVLYSNPPSGPANGVLAEGYITEEHVIGAIEGNLYALIDAIQSGNIYVNVHTSNVPSGEIRGQL